VFNAHGDVVQLANAAGTVTKEYQYDSFGVEIEPEENDNNPWRYCGEYFDKETETIYLRMRYYSPKTGRFLTEDPAYDGLNWYTYCSNSPVMRIDPWGLEDVILTYIAEKNGGTAIYHEETVNDVRKQQVTVTINGITKVYTINEKDSVIKIINGKSVIDSNILLRDFKLGDRENSIHMAGDKFDDPDHAAMAFGFMYGERSKRERQEYAASIDKDSDGKFSFNGVTNSSMFAKDPNNMTDAERNHFQLSYTANSVGHIHTHWRSDGNLNFSNPEDYNGASSQTQFMYLVNRNGEIYFSYRSKISQNTINGFTHGTRIINLK